jgi:membrane-associated phospholipid phosphatase
MLVGGVVGYIAYPAAPPWMAAKNGYIDKIDRITGRGWSELNLDTVSKTFDRGVAVLNPVAAMPSLHAATALLVVVWFFPNRSWWTRVALLLHPIAMTVALVYFGEHYVIDALAGFLLVLLAWRGSDWWERRSFATN